jgi:hypothetical protein
MSEYKTWALAVSELNESDIIWLRGLGVEVRSEALTNRVYSAGHVVTEYVTGYKIDVITNCAKQETMLQLKYGKNLVLNTVFNISKSTYENQHLASHSRP